VFPYLPIAPHEVEWNLSTRRDSRLKILSANVLQENNSAERLLKLIEHHAPDVVVLCEVNQAWLERLRPVELQFDFQLVHPQENKYGIALYSNLEVATATVRRLVRDDIPSIDATIRLESGQVVRLFAVHPNPPRPGEDTTKRDGELILVGREVREDPTAIVLGDLNDVGWSRTTNLFQEVSGLLDPRKGRGFFSTFDATSMFWRYPLDYLFHSDDFRVVRLQVLTDIGSDHFPLFVELSHEPAAAFSQETPDLDAGDREDAQDSVEAAKQAR
jgi:endonuclease/exonuclease/phosphatase (EEP) superfamily protein YafD